MNNRCTGEKHGRVGKVSGVAGLVHTVNISAWRLASGRV